jgi:hypothetical protein
VLRHLAVARLWLLEPIAFALTLDRALPRLASFGLAGWTVVATRLAVVAAGIAIGRPLQAREGGAWRGVAWWCLASIGATIAGRVWPELPTGWAPSEARVVAALAVAVDLAGAAVAAVLARRERAARDSS